MYRFAASLVVVLVVLGVLGVLACACELDVVQLGVPKTCATALVAAGESGGVDDASPLRLDGGAGFLPADSASPIYFEAVLNTDVDTGSIGVASSSASLLAAQVLDGERAGVVVGVAADPVVQGIAFRHNGVWENRSDPDASVYAHALPAHGAPIHPAASLSAASSLTFILDGFRDGTPIGHTSVPAACAASIAASNASSE